MSTIHDRARENLPESWDVISNMPYGPALLTGKTEFVKYKLFSTIVNATVEESVYNPIEIQYAAKQVALQVIPIAIDYYKSKKQSISTQGGSTESVTYPDRINALEKLYDLLTREVIDLASELPSGSITKRKRKIIPAYGTERDLVTQDPSEYPKKWESNIPSNLPWGPPSR